MDLKAYYRKLRQLEADLLGPDVVVVSNPTPDGGRAGVLTETPRHIAARMILDGIARLAMEAEAALFREQEAEAKREADQKAMAGRLQVTVVAEADTRKTVPGTVKGPKGA